MKISLKKILLLSTMAAAAGSLASANVTILENTDFTETPPLWSIGGNLYKGSPGNYVWQQFAEIKAVDIPEFVKPSGDGFTFDSWDDGVSDHIEFSLVQGFSATKATTPFTVGDTIVFKGEVSATTTGADTSDVVVHVFIKTLGYTNNQAYQTKPNYSVFKDVTSTLTPFELTITFPDLEVDDSYQVVQMGFEIFTYYDTGANAMDSGQIFFKNLEGYILEESVQWNGYDVDADGFADTGDFMGMVFLNEDPWVYVYDIANWVYLPSQDIAAGAWMNISKVNVAE